MSNKDDKVAELMSRVNEDGVAVSKVSDGFVFVFTRKKLEEIVASLNDKKQDNCVIFVKSSELLN